MNSVSSVRNFCKTPRCPSSEVLLAYRQCKALITERIVIEKHLGECEFCDAELQLLKRHRYYIERSAIAEMPSPLRRLAEGLLARTKSPSQINRFVVPGGQFSH